MDKKSAMIEDAQRVRDRYRSMLETLEDDEHDPDPGVNKEEMIEKLKAAIRPLDEFLALFAPKN